MCKTVFVGLLLLISSGWLQAQSAHSSSEAAHTSGATSTSLTLQGCLQSSLGHYILIDKDGTAHQLIGAANKLNHQVKREIEVTGNQQTKTLDNTLQGGASGAVEQPVFAVKTVKRLADRCQ